MNYEEKYKKVLEQAKQAIENIPDKSLISWLENIFPELRESEDEKIRKELISFFTKRDEFTKNDPFNGLSNKQIISWIEKQGEESSWSEEDEKMCQETIDWFEKKCFPYALESENPARESIKWLKSLKDRVQPQPKQDWSKKDEDAWRTLLFNFENMNQKYLWGDGENCYVIDIINFLKSLKPHWKPTEEQMDILKKVRENLCMGGEWGKGLQSLYNDLKNL